MAPMFLRALPPSAAPEPAPARETPRLVFVCQVCGHTCLSVADLVAHHHVTHERWAVTQ